MSKNNDLDLENKNAVVISVDDVQECAKFFQFFEIPISAGLQKALDNFIADASYVNQCELKYQLADIIVTSQHPVFQDEVFAQVRPETSVVKEDMDFERQLERELTSSEG